MSANFQQISFLATFAMDMFLIRCSLWDIHIFSNHRKWWRYFINNWWFWLLGGGILISPEPLFVWSRATPCFNQKTQLMGGNYIEVHHFENQKWLKIAIFSHNGYIRVICVFFEPLIEQGSCLKLCGRLKEKMLLFFSFITGQ